MESNQSQPVLLDQIIQRINSMTPAQRAEHEANIVAATAGLKFIPSPGPQTLAYHSKADILLYGGEAGGGKSALILGLSLTQHTRSLIMRRQYTDLSGLTEEIIKMNGTRAGYNGSIPPTLRAGERLIEFGAAQRAGDETAWMGRAHDLIGIDEAWQMLESQIRFLIGWLRSTKEGQRTRVILATNPPLTAEGEWIVPMFAPWLDPGHRNPAKQGELRWYVSDDEGKDVEVDSGAHQIFDAKKGEYREATAEEIEQTKNGARIGVAKPMSRTFIRASVNDNPFLARTDYASKLDSLRPEIRAALRDGNFMAGRQDAERQVIPSSWVRAAQARWTPQPPKDVPMCAIGVDPSGGGRDPNAIAQRYDYWYAPIIEIPGSQTPNGENLGGYVLRHRENQAAIGLDMGGGYGNLCYSDLKKNGVEAHAHKGSEASNKRTRDGIWGFVNKRSQVIWQMAEALDPNQPGGSVVALPPDPVLVADLCAARYDIVNWKGKTCVKVEDKEDIVARLGRSTNKGDAVQLANVIGKTGANFQGGFQGEAQRGNNLRVNMGHASQRRNR